MPTNILLLGAGFSYNWGGWLASEVFNQLIGDAGVRQHPPLLDLLHATRKNGGFEAALAQAQRDARDGLDGAAERLAALQAALRRIFAAMNGGYYGATFEFSSSVHSSIGSYLAAFDAIFTLNQDLLIDFHYISVNDISLFHSKPWSNGPSLPGIRPPYGLSRFPQEWAQARWLVPDDPPALGKRTQPVYKLHGSSQWELESGDNLLVMGGSKRDAIAGNALLTRYYDEFVKRCSEPGVRLVAIGYSFSDEHINAAIQAGVTAGMTIAIVDPAGIDVIENGGKTFADAVRSAIIGVSPRTLSQTFESEGPEQDTLLRWLQR